MTVLSGPPVKSEARLISDSFEPAEFARAAVGWDRLRVEAEAERELRAAELLWAASQRDRKPGARPRGLGRYINFLARLCEWLRTGTAPRFARQDTRQPLLAIAEALVGRGQLDPSALARLRGRPRDRT